MNSSRANIDVTHHCEINFVKAPFAWVSAEEIEGGRTRLTLEKASARKTESKNNKSTKNNRSARVGRQNLLSDTNKPLLKYTFSPHIWSQMSFQSNIWNMFRFNPQSPESALIAEKINALFESGLMIGFIVSIGLSLQIICRENHLFPSAHFHTFTLTFINCICVFVFVYLTVGNISFGVLGLFKNIAL